MSVLHGSEFSIITHGRLVVMAFESPEELAFLARSLNYIVETNKTLPPEQRYTRYITGNLLSSNTAPTTKEEIKAAVEYADQFVQGRNKNIPTMSLPSILPEPGDA